MKKITGQQLPIELDSFIFELCNKHEQKATFKSYLHSISQKNQHIELKKERWEQAIDSQVNEEISIYKKKLDSCSNPQEFIKFLLKTSAKNSQTSQAILIVLDYFLLPLPLNECFHWIKYTNKTLPENRFYTISSPLIIRLKSLMSDEDYFHYIKTYFQNKSFKEYIQWLFISLPKALAAKPTARVILKQLDLIKKNPSQDLNATQHSKIFFLILLEKFCTAKNQLLEKKQVDLFTSNFLDHDHPLNRSLILAQLKEWRLQSDIIFEFAHKHPENIDLYLLEFILDQVSSTTIKKEIPIPNEISTAWQKWQKELDLNANFLLLQSFCLKNQLDFNTFAEKLGLAPSLEEKTPFICLKILINYQYAIYEEDESI